MRDTDINVVDKLHSRTNRGLGLGLGIKSLALALTIKSLVTTLPHLCLSKMYCHVFYGTQYIECLRKRVQKLEKRIKSHVIGFRKNVKNVCTVSEAT